MPTVKERVREVLAGHIGETLSRQEIVDFVLAAYPGTSRPSVKPNEYCYNLQNHGI